MERGYLHGFLITLLGVTFLIPDTLLIRLVESGHWTQAFWRSILSGVVLVIGIALVQGPGALRPMVRPGRIDAAMMLAYGTGNLAFIYSATHTLVANTLFLVATTPVFSALIARFVLKETVGLRTVLTIAAVLVGIGVIASGSSGGGEGSLAGDAAALVAALCMAISFSIARANPDRIMIHGTAGGWLLAALAAAFLAPTLAVVQSDWVWIALMGLIVSPGAFACLTYGARLIPAADVGLLLLLEAVFGPVLVWMVIGEEPGSWTLLGGGIVLGTLLVSNVILLLRQRG